jgi:hypothetical protein
VVMRSLWSSTSLSLITTDPETLSGICNLPSVGNSRRLEAVVEGPEQGGEQ